MKKYLIGAAATLVLISSLFVGAKYSHVFEENLGLSVTPTSLTVASNQKVAINDAGYLGKTVEITPMGALRTSKTVRLVGAIMTDTAVDPNFWSIATTTSGTVSVANAQMIIRTGAGANSSAIVTSQRAARYIGASSNMYRSILQMDTVGTLNNLREWGVGSATDGAFFQLSSTTLNVCTRKTSVLSCVASASWNGTAFTMDTSVHTYEIYYTNSRVYFTIDDVLVHKVSATEATWTDNMNLKLWHRNTNAGGATTDIQMKVRVATVSRLGELETQPLSYYVSGQTAGTVLKYAAGNIHSIAVSNVSNSSNITLYDNTSAGGTVIYSTGSMGATTQPFSIDLSNIPFSIGLTVVISGANSNLTLIYE